MRHRAITVLLLVATALGGVAVHRSVGPDSARADLVGVDAAHAAAAALGYWTDDRMRRAEHADDLAAIRASQRR